MSKGAKISDRALATLLIVAGAALAAIALFVPAGDLLGRGYGRRRIGLLALGIALLVGSSAQTRRKAAAWWRSAGTVSPLDCILFAAWFGLAVGFFEVAHQGARRYLFGVLIKHTEMVMWMAPLVHLLVFTTLGLGLAIVATLRRSLVNRATVGLLLFGVATWTQTLLHGGLMRFAINAIIIALAVQGARILMAHWDRLARIRKRTGLAMVGAMLALMVGIPAWHWANEKLAVAALPAAPATAPNVLLIVLDTVRADHLGCYGYERPTTPSIDALAKQGVTFDWVLSTSSWTLPAHASMFTGRYHYETTADWVTPMDDRHRTLAEELGERGYRTGGFVGNLSYCSHIHGLERGFQHYEDYYVNPAVIAWHTSIGRRLTRGAKHADKIRNNADVITDQFLNWLPDDDRPFFAFLNYFDAHALYLPPEGWETKFGPLSPNLRRWYARVDWSREEMGQFVDAYDALIAYIDFHIQKIVDRLDASGRLDNTLIIVTGDHGEQFMEHDLTEHGNSLYQPSVRVPLVFYLPKNLPADIHVEDYVSLRDLPATILELAGVQPTETFPGSSLVPHWDSNDTRPKSNSPLLTEISQGINTPAWVPVTKGDMKGLVLDGKFYIRNDGADPELYDAKAEPLLEVNQIETTEGAAIAARMQAEIERITTEKPR